VTTLDIGSITLKIYVRLGIKNLKKML
jgi:hypothetical protein